MATRHIDSETEKEVRLFYVELVNLLQDVPKEVDVFRVLINEGLQSIDLEKRLVLFQAGDDAWINIAKKVLDEINNGYPVEFLRPGLIIELADKYSQTWSQFKLATSHNKIVKMLGREHLNLLNENTGTYSYLDEEVSPEEIHRIYTGQLRLAFSLNGKNTLSLDETQSDALREVLRDERLSVQFRRVNPGSIAPDFEIALHVKTHEKNSGWLVTDDHSGTYQAFMDDLSSVSLIPTSLLGHLEKVGVSITDKVRWNELTAHAYEPITYQQWFIKLARTGRKDGVQFECLGELKEEAVRTVLGDHMFEPKQIQTFIDNVQHRA